MFKKTVKAFSDIKTNFHDYKNFALIKKTKSTKSISL